MDMKDQKPYLKIGYARDVTSRRGYLLYRALEMIPGLLAWLTFALMILGSFFAPLWAVFFIIAFDLYWLLKTAYLSWHLRNSFKTMHEHMQTDWVEKLDHLNLAHQKLGIRNWRDDLWHLIILPYHKESHEIVRDTCRAILAAEYPQKQLMVVLSGEERAGIEAEEIGKRIQEEFALKFGKFLFTVHHDQPGELAGKGANETWAAIKAKEEIIDRERIPYERIIVSVFDVDTVISSHYFARLAYLYLTVEKPLRTSFQPVPLFINNIWEASALARVMAFSSTFWHLMNQMRPERLVSFSSHSFPFKALVELGFWQTNVVSEDSRIFWQGLLAFDGDWRVEPMLVPVSMDANVAETFWRTLKNIYLQQRRWAYGCADIPYFLYGFLHNRKVPVKTKLYWSFHLLEGFWSWATNSIMIFMMGWLPILLGGELFGTTVLAHNVPRMTRWILTFAMLGIVTSIYLTLKLLPPRPEKLGRHRRIMMVVQWLFIPFSLVVFGSLPAIEAETRLMLGKYLGFWPTPKIRKGIQKQVF